LQDSISTTDREGRYLGRVRENNISEARGYRSWLRSPRGIGNGIRRMKSR